MTGRGFAREDGMEERAGERRASRRGTATGRAAAVAGLLLASLPAAAGPRLVLVSLDGLIPPYYTRAVELGLKVPNLRRLMRDGAYARGVTGVFPTVTYPSHTTLITGVSPRVHGIPSNTVFDPLERANGAWNWFASDVRVPTL